MTTASRRRVRSLAGLIVLTLGAGSAMAQPATTAPAASMTGTVLYRMTLLRAAPGRFDELLAEVRARVSGTGGVAVRHSQGDQWDFLTLVPVAATTLVGTPPLGRAYADALAAWQEDELVRGPSLDTVPGFATATLYHFEMFDAAPGRLDELVREREMENAYLAGVGRPSNAIFTREFGASWDAFTIGAYRDWRHYAERDMVTPEQARSAALAAGFASDAAIGPYMRSLILSHHDTLAGPVR